VPVHKAVRLYIGNRRESAIYQIGEQIRHVPHVIRNHARVVRLILEWVADIAIAPVEWVARSIGIETATMIFPRDLVRRQHITDAPLHRLRKRRDRSAPILWG